MARSPIDPKPQRTPASQAGEVLGVGLQFAAAILLFLFAGRWLDERLGTEPWLLLMGVLVGAGAGFFSLYRQLVIVPRERERRRREGESKD
jgi:ATP synthase protein I